MNQLTTLDKKLWTVESRHDLQHLEDIQIKHNITKEQVQQEIAKDLYGKMLNELRKSFRVGVDTLPNGEEQYHIQGYCLTRREMFETIKECLDMDDKGKQMLLEKINKALL